jgi:NDP-sugar pyrophosphorylase family protein
VPNREFMRYGGVLLDRLSRVTAFARRGPAAEGSFHFIGVQIVDGRVFDPIRPGEAASTIGGIYDTLVAAQAGAVRGFVSDAAFSDVGTIEDYWRTSQVFAAREGASRSSTARTTVDPSARVTQSILWDDVMIEADAIIDECIVTDGVTIRAGERYRRAVLVSGETGAVIASPMSFIT